MVSLGPDQPGAPLNTPLVPASNFLLGGDRDLFEVITEVPTPLTLRFQPPDDGASVVDLHLSGSGKLRGEFTANQPEVRYSVEFPAGRNLIDLRARENGVSGRWVLSLERTETPEKGEPNGVLALPRDGLLSGRIGGFDPEDRVFIPLPEGEGDLVVTCDGAFKALDLRTYGDDKHLLRVSPGIAGVLPYGPNLGGAVEMRIFAEQAPDNYACRIAFPPRDDAFSTVTHDEATDADAPTPLPPNAEVTGQFGEGDRGDRLSLMLEPGALSALTCRDGSGAALPPRRLRPVGSEALTAALRQQPLADGSIVITGPPSGEAVLEIRPGGDDAAWRCSLAGADRFRAPSDMGAMAAFTAPRDRARNSDAEALAAYDPQAALAVLQTAIDAMQWPTAEVAAELREGPNVSQEILDAAQRLESDLIMLGAYTTYLLQVVMPEYPGVALLLSIPVAFLVSGGVGVLIERGVIRFLYGRPLETLLATFGISLILQQFVRVVISPQNVPVSNPSWMSGSIEISNVLSLTWNRIYIIVFSLMVFAALFMILKKTALGLQVRAVAQNRAMARAMGVRSERVDALTFGLGSGIAGIAGVALSQLTNVGPNLGQSYIIDSFMVVVFGGVGNLWGTLVAGMTLGVANKIMEPWAGAVLAKILVLVFIILFIQKRPRGLFPQKGRAAEG